MVTFTMGMGWPHHQAVLVCKNEDLCLHRRENIPICQKNMVLLQSVQTCNRWPPRISSSPAKPSELHQPRCGDVSDEGESPLDVLLWQQQPITFSGGQFYCRSGSLFAGDTISTERASFHGRSGDIKIKIPLHLPRKVKHIIDDRSDIERPFTRYPLTYLSDLLPFNGSPSCTAKALGFPLHVLFSNKLVYFIPAGVKRKKKKRPKERLKHTKSFLWW